MFEDIDLKIADEKADETTQFHLSTVYGCTRTGCWGTTCMWPC